MLRRTVRALALATLCLPLFAGLASAAQISQISFDVTGGTFLGPASVGPITGGSLVITPTSGSVSTPFVGFTPATMVLNVTGPSGLFTVVLDFGHAIGSITPSLLIGAGLSTDFSPTGASGPLGSVGLYRARLGTFVALNGFGTSPLVVSFGTTVTPILNHAFSFTIGNEVRTIVPEPATGAMLGLGLLGLGVAAGSRRRSRTRRGSRG